jgi:hypothetical protein
MTALPDRDFGTALLVACDLIASVAGQISQERFGLSCPEGRRAKSRQHQDSIKAGSRQDQDAIKALSRQHQDAIKTASIPRRIEFA